MTSRSTTVARRRGGARMVTVGFLGVGGSAFVMLAVGSRMLGAVLFAGFGLAWTISSIYGIGLANPVEQFINRNRNTGLTRALRGPVWTLGIGAGLSVTVGAVIAGSGGTTDRVAVVASVGVAALGWWVLALVRGRLVGAGDLLAYAIVLITESGIRVLLVALAWALPGASRWLLFGSIGLPLLGAAFVGLWWRIPVEGAAGGEPPTFEQLWFVAMSLGIQVCLNGAPILLQWQFSGVRIGVVGAFVAASTYFRIPTILVGGIQTRALVELSHARGAGDVDTFRRRTKVSVRQVGLVTGVATTALGVVAPWLLPWYYGRPPGLPLAVLVGLALSTVLVSVGMAAVLPLLATSRALVAGGSWLIGAAVSAGCFAFAGGRWLPVVVGLVLGPLTVVALTVRYWWQPAAPAS